MEGPVQTADRAPGWGMRGPTEDKDLGGERKLENRGGPWRVGEATLDGRGLGLEGGMSLEGGEGLEGGPLEGGGGPGGGGLGRLSRAEWAGGH